MYKKIIFLMFLLSASFYFLSGKKNTKEELKCSTPVINDDSRAWLYDKNAMQAEFHHFDVAAIAEI
jgi:hypothetical protein